MLAVPSMHDKTVAVLGLGRSGRSVCRALAESGARTWAWDDALRAPRRVPPPPARRSSTSPCATGPGSTGWC